MKQPGFNPKHAPPPGKSRVAVGALLVAIAALVYLLAGGC